jgi:uncharacterized protein (UPF0248 family)
VEGKQTGGISFFGANAKRPCDDSGNVKTVRSVLNELRWREDRDLSMVEVEYVHRGAPGDIASVRGEDILELEPWMMVIRRKGRGDGYAGPGARRTNRAAGGPSSPIPGRAAIPYHRVLRILYDGEVVFDRPPGHPQKA